MPKCFSEKKKKNQTRATHFDDRGRVPFREKNSNCDGRNKVERARKRKAYDLAASTSQRGAQLITHQLSWQQKDQPMSREGECCSSNNVQLDAAIRRRHSPAPNGLCSRVCVTSKRTKDSPVEDRWQLSDSGRRTRRWQDTHTKNEDRSIIKQNGWMCLPAGIRSCQIQASSPPPHVLYSARRGNSLFWRAPTFVTYPSISILRVCAYTHTHGVKDTTGETNTRGNQMWTHTIDMLCVGSAGNPSSWRWVTVSFTFSTE